MKRCNYCGGENEDAAAYCRDCGNPFADPSADTSQQRPEPVALSGTAWHQLPRSKRIGWLLCLLGLAVLIAIGGQLLRRDARSANAPRVVVLATWSSNGEQFVTFRPEPPSADIPYFDLVSASTDTGAQPETIRSFGRVWPVRAAQDTNFSTRCVALPVRVFPVPGRPPIAYTPGSYTIAYTPTEGGCRLRVGVALPRKGAGDYAGRLRNCWYQKSLGMLRLKSHQDPFFVLLPIFTNALPGKL